MKLFRKLIGWIRNGNIKLSVKNDLLISDSFKDKEKQIKKINDTHRK